MVADKDRSSGAHAERHATTRTFVFSGRSDEATVGLERECVDFFSFCFLVLLLLVLGVCSTYAMVLALDYCRVFSYVSPLPDSDVMFHVLLGDLYGTCVDFLGLLGRVHVSSIPYLPHTFYSTCI